MTATTASTANTAATAPSAFDPTAPEFAATASAFTGIFHIEPRQASAMLAILAESKQRLAENETKLKAASDAAQPNTQQDPASALPSPELLALAQEHDAIIQGTVARLKQELGSEAFARLDAYLHRYWGNVRAA